MRILIAGGFGFIGGRLASHFSKAGHHVVLGSRNTNNPPPWLPQTEVIQILWDDDRALEHSCKGFDVVIQAAGMNAQDCANNPVTALAFNGVASARLVSAACRAGVQRFIYFSTCHVYASPLVGIITEETCTRNIHPYATSHLAGEHAVLSASQLGKIEGIVLRLSNAFGAPMHKDVNCWMLLVNELCRQAVETRTLVLQTSGLQQRDFIGLKEVCRVTEYFSVSRREFKPTEIFNVGAGMSQTVLEMSHLIQERCTKVLGFKPNLKHTQGDLNQENRKLTYITDSLNSSGISSKSMDNIAEIDSLLQYCQLVFILNKVKINE